MDSGKYIGVPLAHDLMAAICSMPPAPLLLPLWQRFANQQ
jgi:hypothetical protein